MDGRHAFQRKSQKERVSQRQSQARDQDRQHEPARWWTLSVRQQQKRRPKHTGCDDPRAWWHQGPINSPNDGKGRQRTLMTSDVAHPKAGRLPRVLPSHGPGGPAPVYDTSQRTIPKERPIYENPTTHRDILNIEVSSVTLAKLENGCAAFWRNEPRDAMYVIATRLVKEDWVKPSAVAEGLGVVLLTWNQAAYRYGSFDFHALEDLLKRNQAALDSYRRRKIASFNSEKEENAIRALFDEMLDALAYTESKRKTPVGAAKALHLLAPSFFPLWDKEIAKGCGCNWYAHAGSAANYVAFMDYTRDATALLERQFASTQAPTSLPKARNLASSLSKRAGRSKTMLKLFDEYLCAKHTKGWI